MPMRYTAWSTVARPIAHSIHITMILYIGILNVWYHVSGKIASEVTVRGEGGVAGEGRTVCSLSFSWSISFFGLCLIFLFSISFSFVRLPFSFSHFCFFCYFSVWLATFLGFLSAFVTLTGVSGRDDPRNVVTLVMSYVCHFTLRTYEHIWVQVYQLFQM